MKIILQVIAIGVMALSTSAAFAENSASLEDGVQQAAQDVAAYQQARQSLPDAQDPIVKLISGDDGWRFFNCTWSFDQQDCERICADWGAQQGAKDTRCEARIRCTGDAGNGWSCWFKIR